MSQKITPHLWFDKKAREAAELYTSLLENSKITNVTTLHNTPSGDADIVSFTLSGLPFMAISAGPYFKFNPSISFHVKLKTKNEVDRAWKKLSKGGKVLMELGKYPFSERYGWIQDKYGLSWQIIYTKEEITQSIVPALMFTQDMAGKAREAIRYYTKVFPVSNIDVITEYGKNELNEKEDNIMYSEFSLADQKFIAMDSGFGHEFKFNEAVSFIVKCKDQKEIDYYWEKLSAHPKSEQCGWLKDKYGVSWQIVPTVMDEMMADKDPKRIARVTEAFLKMKKFDIAKLQEAYKSE